VRSVRGLEGVTLRDRSDTSRAIADAAKALVQACRTRIGDDGEGEVLITTGAIAGVGDLTPEAREALHALVRALALPEARWTSQPPERAGWYWVRDPHGPSSASVRECAQDPRERWVVVDDSGARVPWTHERWGGELPRPPDA
jgi:hypothetical protein